MAFNVMLMRKCNSLVIIERLMQIDDCDKNIARYCVKLHRSSSKIYYNKIMFLNILYNNK